MLIREKGSVNKYRLMIVSHDLKIGGLQQVVVNICNCIDREKFDTKVLCLRDLGPFANDIEQMGIKVFCLPHNRGRTDYYSFLKVAKIFKRERIEIIHTHNTQPFIDGTIGALFSGVKTIVHTDHARDFPDKRRYMFTEWLMSQFAYKVVGVSEHTSQNLAKYEKISPRKIVTIPNGIHVPKYEIAIDKKQKRKELGISHDGPIIGLGVRLTEQKGITYLLQAMPEVIKAFEDITLVIAGEGPLADDLKRQSIALEIDRNVLFAGPRFDMPELLSLFDLYVLPSLWEGLPMVLLEAMAAGCPILATEVGGISAAIKHRYNGLLVKSKDPVALSSGIVDLLSSDQTRNLFVRNSLKIFHERFSAEIMTKQYERLYLRKL